ncbi:hypothetical protein ACOME3_008326 [Neoechinorhynchus agilis]
MDEFHFDIGHWEFSQLNKISEKNVCHEGAAIAENNWRNDCEQKRQCLKGKILLPLSSVSTVPPLPTRTLSPFKLDGKKVKTIDVIINSDGTLLAFLKVFCKSLQWQY